MAPNVALIVLDTARADAFEPYGAPPGSSPTVADLGRRGAVADAVFSTACWTVPSHTSMLTGLLPRASGVNQVSGDDAHPRFRAILEAHRDRLLPDVLRRNGYETRAVSTNHWLTEWSGFSTGFDEFAFVDTKRQAELSGGALRKRLRWDLEGALARVDDGAREAARVIETWAGERRDDPFFWFVNLVECHSPYLPPRPYTTLGAVERVRAAEDARRYLHLGAVWQACAGGLEVPEEALERMRRLYRDAIRLLDDWVARLCMRLDEAGILDETLVIVVSDHGENLGEAGLMGHAFSLDDRLIHVPLVAAGPGADRIAGARSLVELPRLIARAVGLDEHPWADELPDGGVAVAQFDPPTGADDPRVERALEEWGLGPDAAERITTPFTCATDGSMKLMRRGERTELYDLGADPLELSPLPPEGAPEELRAALDHPATLATAAAPGAGPGEGIPDAEREQLEQRMRLLGYM